MNLFGLGIDFLASKITIIIFLLFSLNKFKPTTNHKLLFQLLTPLIIFFSLLSLISVLNITPNANKFFYFPFFLNIILFYLLVNITIDRPKVLFTGLFFYALSFFLLSILFYMGFSTSISNDGRPTIFGMNQNHLGIGICISIFTFISAIFENPLKFSKKRYILFIPLLLLLIFMIITGSRVAFMSFLSGIIVFIFFKKSLSSSKKSLIFIISTILFLVLWVIYLKNSFLVSRLSDTVNEGDLASRDWIWIQLFDIISKNPLFGVGITGYTNVMDNLSPHNVLLEIVCYTGIIGLIIFLFFLIRIIKIAFINNTQNGDLLSLALILPIVGIILSGQILEQKYIWLVFAYITSVNNKLIN